MKTIKSEMLGGSIPLRASKNPVIGVFRHHCGSIASVHQAKGRKSHLRYLHCDNCGCDQAAGEEYKKEIRKKSIACIEELEQAENQPQKNETEDLTYKVKPTVEQSVETPLSEPLPTNENAVFTEIEPLQNATVENNEISNALPVETTVNKPVKQPLPTVEQTTAQTAKNAVVDEVKPVKTEQPTIAPQKTAEQNTVKPLRVGFAALLGGVIGGVLALVA